MKQVLLIEPNVELESLFSLNLRTYVGIDFMCKKKAEYAINAFEKENNQFSLIIMRNKIGAERTAEVMHRFLTENSIEIPLIIIGKSQFVDSDSIKVLSSLLELKPIIQNAAKLLGVTAQDMARLEVPEYFSIPINYFSHLKRSVVDVYEKEISNDSNFNLKFEAMKDLTPELVKNYIAEGVTSLYIKKLDRLKFVNNVTQEIMSKLNEKDLEADDSLILAENNLDLLQMKLTAIGITEETVELAQKSMRNIVGTAKQYPRMGKLMKRLLNNKASYRFKNVQILTYLGQHMMDSIDWGSDEQKEKFAFITFFHDITLETDAQAMILSEAELKNSSLDDREKSLVKKHAQMSAEIVSKYPHAPMGADQIIRQHHGVLNGLGFADSYGANLSPMSIVFILAEDFTKYLILSENELKIDKKIEQMRKRYTTQRFQKLIDILEKVTI